MRVFARILPLTVVILTATATSATAAPQDADAARSRRRTPVVDVFERCRDSVVNISTTRVVRMRSPFGSRLDDVFDIPFDLRRRDRRVQSVGSGVVVHESGYIITNAHVVAQASDVHVVLADERELPATIVAVDPEHDLAVLKVAAAAPLPAIHLGRSDDLMIGETVVAIGNPLGLQHSVTAGILSALGRELRFSGDTIYRDLIQTDAPINPGNSGGPLLNINGELIGINTAIRGDAQNIGFAIPVDALWKLLPAMLDIERRERVRFGLLVVGPEPKVVAVRPGSPAAEAGLQVNDRILRFHDTPLRNAIDYQVRLLEAAPGDTVHLSIERGGRPRDVDVPLESIPIPDGRVLARAALGIVLTEVPPELKRRYDLPDYIGLMVEEVVPGSPAEYAGIIKSDLLLRLDRVSVVTLDDVGLALEQVRVGERVMIEGLRIATDPPFLWSTVLRVRAGNQGNNP